MKVENLIEGEYYYCDWDGFSHIFECKYNGASIDIDDNRFTDRCWKFWEMKATNIRPVTKDEREWLDLCIKEGKFVDKPDKIKEGFKVDDWVEHIDSSDPKPEQIIGFHSNGCLSLKGKKREHCYIKDYRLATPEEIASVEKSKFEIGKWYKLKNSSGTKFLGYIDKKNHYYGFGPTGKWIESDLVKPDHSKYIQATDSEVKDRLLFYAKEKYPVGSFYKCFVNKDKCEIRFDDVQFTDNLDGIVDSDIGYIYHDGKWAEIVEESKPKNDTWCIQITKENREVVKKWYARTNPSYNIGAYYGLKENVKHARGSNMVPWTKDDIISTEEFYKKIGHVPPSFGENPCKQVAVDSLKDDYPVEIYGGCNDDGALDDFMKGQEVGRVRKRKRFNPPKI